MRKPIEFEMFVRQPVEAVMEQMKQDAHAALEIEAEELHRAVFGWVMAQLGDDKPDWLDDELNRLKE